MANSDGIEGETIGGFTMPQIRTKFLNGLRISPDGEIIIKDKDLAKLIKKGKLDPLAFLDKCPVTNKCTNTGC